MLKVYITNKAYYYAEILPNYEIVASVESADLIIFTGGADVSPKLYGEENVYSYCDNVRDLDEEKVFKKAIENNIPCLGICRGSQFLTVMNGGKLIQDVDNHAIMGTHLIKNFDKEYKKNLLPITSTHHQMMYPFNLDKEDYKLIAISASKRSTIYLYDQGIYSAEDVTTEPEIVYYPKTNSLAIQGHPEQMDKECDTVKYVNFLIDKYLLK